MPRNPRKGSPTGVYHFINRGVNKKKLFHAPKDYHYYLSLLREYSHKEGIGIYHYCLMSNHTHLLLKADTLEALSRFGHYVQRRYAYYYCKVYSWSEQVFRKRFTSVAIKNDPHFLECARYIERNPLVANLVKSPDNYAYSSYSFYAAGKADPLISQSPCFEELGRTPEERKLVWRFYILQNREEAYEPPKGLALKELTCPF